MATIVSAAGSWSLVRPTRIARTKVPQTDDFTGMTAVVRLRARNCVAPRLGSATQQVPDPAARSEAGHSPPDWGVRPRFVPAPVDRSDDRNENPAGVSQCPAPT